MSQLQTKTGPASQHPKKQKKAEKPAEYVEGLAKGLAIIECFDAGHREMTLSEVARRVNISPAAARRSLLTLMSLGYVGQSDKRFHLRPKVMALGTAYYVSAQIEELLQPDLRRVVELFGDACSVGTRDNQHVIYIAHVSVQRARRASAMVGARYPAYATSLGRVLLSGLSHAALDDYLAEADLQPLTGKTVTDREQLREIVIETRKNGYATAVDQLDYGVTALAVPIRGQGNEIIAALNTSGYTGMVSPEQLVSERLVEMQRTASAITAAIARYPALAASIRF